MVDFLIRLLFSRSFAVALWGGLILTFFWSRLATKLLHPLFIPGLAVAGVLLLLIPLLNATAPRLHPHCSHGCSHPSHPHRELDWIPFLTLSIPAILGFYCLWNGFSFHSIAQRHPFTPPPSNYEGASLGLPPPLQLSDEEDGYRRLNIIDLNLISEQSALRQRWEGRKIKITGQWIAHPQGTEPRLMRILMFCCIADALPVFTELSSGDQVSSQKEMEWFEIKGTLQFSKKPQSWKPVVRIEHIESILEPPDLYLGGDFGRRRLDLYSPTD